MARQSSGICGPCWPIFRNPGSSGQLELERYSPDKPEVNPGLSSHRPLGCGDRGKMQRKCIHRCLSICIFIYVLLYGLILFVDLNSLILASLFSNPPRRRRSSSSVFLVASAKIQRFAEPAFIFVNRIINRGRFGSRNRGWWISSWAKENRFTLLDDRDHLLLRLPNPPSLLFHPARIA
jgi:hypothetical protein